MGVASLVLGIISLVFVLIPPLWLVGWIGAIVGVIGIVLGALGRKKCKSGKPADRVSNRWSRDEHHRDYPFGYHFCSMCNCDEKRRGYDERSEITTRVSEEPREKPRRTQIIFFALRRRAGATWPFFFILVICVSYNI